MTLRPLAFALCVTCWVPTAHAQEVDGFASCEQAAQEAEAAYGLPAGLLTAIGRVESGRPDPASGRVRPWAWTLNANGVGAYWPDQVAAATAVTSLQARGVSSIDVGCFQINLIHHPNAFPTLFDAFVPSTNAAYAARFLLELRQRTGNWVSAVMAYHSATPALGQAYWTQVQASWSGSAALAVSAASVPPVATAASAGLVHVWTPALPGTAPSEIRLGNGEVPLPTVTYFISREAALSTRS